MGELSFGQQLGQSVATAGVQAGANGLLGLAGARLSYKYNKKLMAKQNQYNIEAFKRENARQDSLIRNQYVMNKEALRAAGLSESMAGTDATGISAPSATNMDVPSNPSASQFDLGKLDLQQSLAFAEIGKVLADTKKTQSETEYQDMQNRLYSIYGEQQILAALQNMNEDTKLKHEQMLYTDQQRLNSIALTDAQIDEISSRIDISYQKLDPELKLLAAETFKAQQDGNLSKAKINEVWQNIKESQERISLMKTQEGLNNAQSDLAIASAKNIVQQTRTEKWKTVEQMNSAQMKQFEETLQREMGYTAAKAKKVAETILPIGALWAAFKALK